MENKENNSGNSNGNFKITGDWASQSKRLKEQFSVLNDQDLKFEPGKENDLLKHLETKLNKKREEVVSILEKVQNTPSAL
jgi:hypothetical protein